MFAILAIALTLATPAAPSTSSASVDRVAGQWTGPFGNADWTFDLVQDAKGWSGRYRTTKAPTWKPLTDVAVTQGCATFSLTSEPRLTFSLALTPDGAAMAGDLTIAGRATLPFAARREP